MNACTYARTDPAETRLDAYQGKSLRIVGPPPSGISGIEGRRFVRSHLGLPPMSYVKI